MAGVRGQPGSEVCGWIRVRQIAGVGLWLGSKVSLWPGQEPGYGLTEGSVCDKNRSQSVFRSGLCSSARSKARRAKVSAQPRPELQERLRSQPKMDDLQLTS